MPRNIVATNRPCFLDLGGGVILEGRQVDVSPSYVSPLDPTGQSSKYRDDDQGKVLSVDMFFIRYGEAERFGQPEMYDYGAGTHPAYLTPQVPYQTYADELGKDGRPDVYDPDVGSYDWIGMGTREGEDCLFMLFTRPTGGTDLPGLGWYHGGAWTVNSIIGQQHNPCFLSAHKGIGAAVMGYRLSTFGHHPLAEYLEDGEPSVAYLDQRLGLEFMDINAEALGLGARKPAIGGTSAGGATVQLFMEDDDAQALFSGVWCDSGGGSGVYMGPDSWQHGYVYLTESFRRSVTGMSDVLSSMSPDYETVKEAIDDEGYAWALRHAARPEHIQALSDMGPEVTAQSIKNVLMGTGDLQMIERGASKNYYPMKRSQYDTAIAAARDGKYRKPFFILFAECEALNLEGGDYTTIRNALRAMSPEFLNGLAQRVGYATYEAWKAAAWQPKAPEYPLGLESLPSAQFKRSVDPWAADCENRRVLYTHAIFGLPAWITAKLAYDGGNTNVWRAVYNFSANSVWAGHSMATAAAFGMTNWLVGGVQNFPAADPPGYYSNLRMDAIYMSEVMMQALAAFCATGDPAGEYEYEGFDLFVDNPPADGGSLTHDWPRYDPTKPGHVNVIGKYFDPLDNLNAGTFFAGTGTLDLNSQRDAHVTYAEYMNAAMLDYQSRIG